MDGIICGHIHKPEIRDINGILYCNDGDWVESLSALVEDAQGQLSLVTWLDIMQSITSRPLATDVESEVDAEIDMDAEVSVAV